MHEKVALECRHGQTCSTYATSTIPAHTIVLNSEPIIGFQEISSVGYAVVCARCFRMTGSIELQLFNAFEHLEGRARPTTSLLHQLPKLPRSEIVNLPPVVPCSASQTCDAVYCSTACRDAAWKDYHCLLCPCNIHTPTSTENPDLARFYDHANESNDIFRLTAQAITNVMLKARSELESSTEVELEMASPEAAWEALQRAWVPYSLGAKKLWWEVASVPWDCSIAEETSLREEFKSQAEESLRILKVALEQRDQGLCAAFPALLQLEVWASLAGMFELQDCMQSTMVASPVPTWAQDIYYNQEKLNASDWEAIHSYGAIQAFEGIEVMMDGNDESEWVCVCSVFSPLQACFNRSKTPNARRITRGDDGKSKLLCPGICLSAPMSLPYLNSCELASTPNPTILNSLSVIFLFCSCYCCGT